MTVSQSVIIFGVVLLYWFISISLVFINKILLSDKIYDLKAPILLTWFQCIITLLLCFAINFASKYCKYIRNIPPCPIRWKYCYEALPLSIVFVCMIAFNNLCLKFVGISFYYVGRSLTTVFNVIFIYIILKQKTSIRAIGCCLIIIFGFALGVDQEKALGSVSFVGILYGVLASASVALFSIYMKKLLPLMDNSIWRVTFYNNLNACLIFIPIIFSNGELQRFIGMALPTTDNNGDEKLHSSLLFESKFWGMVWASGFFGFAIGYVTGLQIHVTSPLTHNISGTAKAAFQTVLGVVWAHEHKSVVWWASNLIVLFGSMAYTHIRHSEMVNATKTRSTVNSLKKRNIAGSRKHRNATSLPRIKNQTEDSVESVTINVNQNDSFNSTVTAHNINMKPITDKTPLL